VWSKEKLLNFVICQYELEFSIKSNLEFLKVNISKITEIGINLRITPIKSLVIKVRKYDNKLFG
jgi:hypothetical protein